MFNHPTPGEYATRVLTRYICDITNQKVIYNISDNKYKNIKLRRLTKYDITVPAVPSRPCGCLDFVIKKRCNGGYILISVYFSHDYNNICELYNDYVKYTHRSYMGCIKQILTDLNNPGVVSCDSPVYSGRQQVNNPGDLITINGISHDMRYFIEN